MLYISNWDQIYCIMHQLTNIYNNSSYLMRIPRSINITSPFNNGIFDQSHQKNVIEDPYLPFPVWFNNCDLYFDTRRYISINIFVKLSSYLIIGLRQWQHRLIQMMAWHWDDILSIQHFLLLVILLLYYILSDLWFVSDYFSLGIFLILYFVLSLPNYVMLNYQGLFLSLSLLL